MSTDSQARSWQPHKWRQRRRFAELKTATRDPAGDQTAAVLKLYDAELQEALAERQRCAWDFARELQFVALVAQRSKCLEHAAQAADWSPLWEEAPAELLATTCEDMTRCEQQIDRWLAATRHDGEAAELEQLVAQTGQTKKNLSKKQRHILDRPVLNAARRPSVAALRIVLRRFAGLLPAFARSAVDARSQEPGMAAGGRALFALGVEAGWQAAKICFAEEIQQFLEQTQRELAAGKGSSCLSRHPGLLAKLTRAYLRLSADKLRSVETSHGACLNTLQAESPADGSADLEDPLGPGAFQNTVLPLIVQEIGEVVDDITIALSYSPSWQEDVDVEDVLEAAAARLQEQYALSQPPIDAVRDLAERYWREGVGAERNKVSGVRDAGGTAWRLHDAISSAMRELADACAELNCESQSP